MLLKGNYQNEGRRQDYSQTKIFRFLKKTVAHLDQTVAHDCIKIKNLLNDSFDSKSEANSSNTTRLWSIFWTRQVF